MARSKLRSRMMHGTVTITTLILVGSTPAAASHKSLPCSVPESFKPLMDLLHALMELAFVAGVGLATLGLLTAALFMMAWGEDYTRRGKKVAKTTLIGTVLLLTSNMIVSFLISELGTTVCS